MSTTSNKKAWLNSLGEPTWLDTVSGHISGSEQILRKTYSSPNLMNAYSDMFKKGWLRIDIDSHRLFFNGVKPSVAQFNWLKQTANERHLLVFNQDTNREVDLESPIYRELES